MKKVVVVFAFTLLISAGLIVFSNKAYAYYKAEPVSCIEREAHLAYHSPCL